MEGFKNVDLNKAAKMLKVEETGKRQRENHIKERFAHRKNLGLK